jgi:hypothetical protein
LLLVFFLPAFMLRGCGANEEKINIIKGSGASNNSLMLSFNQLCRGNAEGFLADGAGLLVSENDADKLNLYSVDTKTTEKTLLLSIADTQNCQIVLSPTGRKVLCSNRLISLSDSSSKLLPTPPRPYLTIPKGFPPLPFYSFSQTGELYFTDPFYYISKYYNRLMSDALLSGSPYKGIPRFMRLGDVKTPAPSVPSTPPDDSALSENGLKFLLRLSGIKVPDDITYIKDMLILEDELKIFFIGYDSKTGHTPLYMADLYSALFITLCDNASLWSLSADRKLIAFIEYPETGKQFETLYTIDIYGENRKMLLGLSSFSGIQWSPTGDYIAYSGGEDLECDIGIIRKDGKDNEFLTHGMSSSGQPHWSKDSSRIAFTSSKSSPSVYVITLNMAMETPYPQYDPIPSNKREIVLWLKKILTMETANILSSGEDA